MPDDTFVILMPAYNEEGCIERVVCSWMDVVKRHAGSEMLVINDGSTDGTGEKLDELKKHLNELSVIHKRNEGHGPAVIQGYSEATKTRHKWVFQTDSDNQLSPEDFCRLWGQREKSDFILGYREKRNDPYYRLFITKAIVLLNLVSFGVLIKDANIPFRLMRTEYLARLLEVLPENLFAPNIFLSILAKKEGQDLLDIPVGHKERKTGKMSMVRWNLVKICMRSVKELLLFRKDMNSIMERLRNGD